MFINCSSFSCLGGNTGSKLCPTGDPHGRQQEDEEQNNFLADISTKKQKQDEANET